MCFCCVEANAGRFLLQSYCVLDRVGHGVLYIRFFVFGLKVWLGSWFF